MIKNSTRKTKEIINAIETGRTRNFEVKYRHGPDLYFYKKLINSRKTTKDVSEFIQDSNKLELVYATLVAWDMNSRGAKMHYFSDFTENILGCLNEFVDLDAISIMDSQKKSHVLRHLKTIYPKLEIMQTKGRLVSNSKLLHFLFPELLVPMDRTNTLHYCYGNTHESRTKYLQIAEVSFAIATAIGDWNIYYDEYWNTTIPKIIDNAIIALVHKY